MDRFLLNNTVDTIDQIREPIKLVNDRGAEGIKSIVFAGSFSITTMLEDRNLKIKGVIEVSSQESTQELSQELSQESPQDKKQTHFCLQKLAGVLSPLNSVKIIEASDFTKEQHVKFFHDIQMDRNFHISDKVIDDIYSRTNDYTGLEGSP
jgi:hypothetical protein